MRSCIFTIFAVAVAAMGALAAPLNERAAGPSGKLLSPSGGSTVAKNGALYVDYEPVEAVDQGKSGQKTTAVIVNLVQGSNVVALGALTTGIHEPSGAEVYPNEYFPFDGSITRKGFKCGDWHVQVTDFQTGPVFNGSFVAASPLVHFAC